MVPGTAEVERLGRSLWSVRLTGDHDLATLPIVDEALQRVAGSDTVIVDVRDASFIDSTIIGVIVWQGRHAGALLLVVPERGQVRRLLGLVEISSSFRVCESREEALRVVSPRGTVDRNVEVR